MGQASVTPGLKSTTSTRQGTSSIRRASEHDSIVNFDAEYGPIPGSVSRPRVPPAPRGSSPTPRVVVRPHSEKIFLIATPYSRAGSQRGQPSQTPEPRPASSHAGTAGQGPARKKTGRRPADPTSRSATPARQ